MTRGQASFQIGGYNEGPELLTVHPKCYSWSTTTPDACKEKNLIAIHRQDSATDAGIE